VEGEKVQVVEIRAIIVKPQKKPLISESVNLSTT